jgi:hypothetical protein
LARRQRDLRGGQTQPLDGVNFTRRAVVGSAFGVDCGREKAFGAQLVADVPRAFSVDPSAPELAERVDGFVAERAHVSERRNAPCACRAARGRLAHDSASRLARNAEELGE